MVKMAIVSGLRAAALAFLVMTIGLGLQGLGRSGWIISLWAQTVAPNTNTSLDRVSALGRIDPRNGVIRVAGPPRSAVVIQELTVEEGDRVSKDQVIAVLLGIEVQRADVARLEAELANAEWELSRNQRLFNQQTISESDLRAFELARNVAAASLERAKAELRLSSVSSVFEHLFTTARCDITTTLITNWSCSALRLRSSDTPKASRGGGCISPLPQRASRL